MRSVSAASASSFVPRTFVPTDRCRGDVNSCRGFVPRIVRYRFGLTPDMTKPWSASIMQLTRAFVERTTVWSLRTSRTDVAGHGGHHPRRWTAAGSDVGGCHKPVLSSPLSSSKAAAPAEVAATYGVARSWVYELVARYRAEGDAAFEPRSRRPHTSPRATPATTVELIVAAPRRARRRTGSMPAPTRSSGTSPQHHQLTVSRATVYRILRRAGLDQGRAEEAATLVLHPLPSRPAQRDAGRPTSPTGGSPTAPTSRSCAGSMTTPATPSRSPPTAASPARSSSTCSRNALDSTRCPGVHVDRQRDGVHHPPVRRHEAAATASNTSSTASASSRRTRRPNHPTTCGKVERFHQTLKRWLTAHPAPATIDELQALCDRFVDEYNQQPPAPLTRRPHPRRRLPRPTQSHPRRQPPDPLPRPPRPRQPRQRLTARRRRPAPHRPRPPPPRNPHHHAHRRPRRPRHPRHHRRDHPQPHHRPHPPLPRHRTTHRRTTTTLRTPKNETSRTLNAGSAVRDVSRHHMERTTGFEPATLTLARSWFSSDWSAQVR